MISYEERTAKLPQCFSVNDVIIKRVYNGVRNKLIVLTFCIYARRTILNSMNESTKRKGRSSSNPTNPSYLKQHWFQIAGNKIK